MSVLFVDDSLMDLSHTIIDDPSVSFQMETTHELKTSEDINSPEITDRITVNDQHHDSFMSTISVSQPYGMKKTLYPHQLHAIHMLEKRERERCVVTFHSQIDLNIGIYADITGYGKTVTMIGLLLRDMMKWETTSEFIHTSILHVYGGGSIIKRSRTCYRRIPTNLVVATATILRQWVQELEETTLRFLVIHGRKMTHHFDPTSYDVVLVPPSCYNMIMTRFPTYAWKRFIYDDPTHCRIPAMRTPIAGYIWMLTATPEMLLYQNRLGSHFLGSIFCPSLDYNVYKHLILKNPDEFVRRSFTLPPLHDFVYHCHEPVVWVIRDLISPTVLDMVSAGNIEGAVRAMGGTSTSNLYELVLCDKQEALKHIQWNIEKWKRHDDQMKSEKWKRRETRVLDEISQLRNRLSIVLSENRCHICFEKICKPVLLTCCQNIFCGQCLLGWIGTAAAQMTSDCPLCRRRLTSTHLVYMKNDISEHPTDHTGVSCQDDSHNHPPNVQPQRVSSPKQKMSKIDTLKQIILRSSESRFIIFSSYNETFTHIRKIFQDLDLEYGELHGRSENRSRVISEFKSGVKKILFLNSIQSGAGENLYEATDIILFHEVSPALRTQLIGRAYRIGRTIPLNVHELRVDCSMGVMS